MKHSILLLDDDHTLTAAVSEYLCKAGYDVDCAHTLEDARYRVAQKSYSAALVDLNLSGAGSREGFDFACHLQGRAPGMLLVLFSGLLTPEIEIETVRRRMKVIAKPTPLPALRAIVSTYLRQRYPISPLAN